MGISTRHYLFAEDGSLRRLPQRIVDALPTGRDAIPEFASTRQRIAYVVLELENSRPAKILDARGEWWTFDDEGCVDRDMNDRMIAILDRIAEPAVKSRGPIVDLVPEIRKREARSKNEWTLSADDLDRIAADLWPGIHGPAPEVSTVKGKAPRKPPLTHEGRYALQRIVPHIVAIAAELGGLTERSLKGLAFEAQRTADFDDEALWRGVADEAKRREAIRAAYRTGKGEWIATVNLTRTDPAAPDVLEHVASVHERCLTRDAAIEAGRRLMAEKAEWLGPETYVEASICSALEWQPEEWK